VCGGGVYERCLNYWLSSIVVEKSATEGVRLIDKSFNSYTIATELHFTFIVV